MNNLYWSIYRNLEKELISLTNIIHFDDEQLKCYSTKLVELLLRISIEIESISKQLYIKNNGKLFENETDMYFDTVCLNHLNNLFNIADKAIFISNPNVFFEKEENIKLKPLKKSFKRGSSGCDWKRAYQSIKHNRSSNFKSGNLKNVIRALGALYILNIYYKDESFNLNNEFELNHFDSSLGSEFFTVKINKDTSSLTENPKYDIEAIYNITISEDIKNNARIALQEMNKIIRNNILQNELYKQAVENGEYLNKYSLNEIISGTALEKIIGKDTYHKYTEKAFRETKMWDVIKDPKYFAFLNH